MKPEEWPRLAITALILVCFAMALLFRYSTGLEETLKNIVMLAVGFWLGSSKGSADNNASVGKALDLAAANTVQPEPNVMLKPGETAQAEETK